MQCREDNPLISVIVPIYNVEPYLCRCLDSLINQTYRALQIILVDDGSPDNCGKVCDEYSKLDSRITVIHKLNGGVSSARNTGLDAAKGDYIGWVDPDDWIEPDMFEYMLGKAMDNSADIVVCGRAEQYPTRTVIKGWSEETIYTREQALEQLINDQALGSYLWDKLWRASLFDGIRFPEGRTFEDVYVMHVLFSRADKTVCLPETKYYYLQRWDGIVRSQNLKARINRYIADKKRYDDLHEEYPQLSPTLEAKCIEASVNVWNSYYKSTAQQRKDCKETLKEISEFSRQHCKEAMEYMNLGITGKLTIPMTQYSAGWAFAAAAIINKFYSAKHYLKGGERLHNGVQV